MTSNGDDVILGSPASNIRVVIGDVRRLIAEALAAMVDGMSGFTVTAVVNCEMEGAGLVAHKADLLLVGVGADAGKALEFVRSLRTLTRRPETVILADAPDPELIKFVLEQQLSGLLMTDTLAPEFAACLDQIARGHAILPAGWHCILAENRNDPLGSLSSRQMEVLELLAEGCSYEQIAVRLFISVNTVKFHVRSIFSHLGVRNRMAAAHLLVQRPRAAPPPRAVVG